MGTVTRIYEICPACNGSGVLAAGLSNTKCFYCEGRKIASSEAFRLWYLALNIKDSAFTKESTKMDTSSVNKAPYIK